MIIKIGTFETVAKFYYLALRNTLELIYDFEILNGQISRPKLI